MLLEPFSAYSGPRQPAMLLVGEAFGEGEDSLRLPLVGESGKELFRMLGEAAPDLAPQEHARISDLHRYGLAWTKHRESWLREASIGFTNTLNLRPPGNKLLELCVEKKDLPHAYSLPAIAKGRYLRPDLLPQLDRLYEEIRTSNPNLVVAMGNTATWAILQLTNIASIRGTTTTAPATVALDQKVLPTFHPASVLYQWSQRPIVIADLTKAFREAKFPEIRRPRRQILVNPSLEEVRRWVEACLARPPKWLACDTETTGGLIDTFGFATSESEALVIPFGPHRYKVGGGFQIVRPIRDGQEVTSYWAPFEEPVVWQLIFALLESPITKLFQNGLYDLQYILRLGCKPCNIKEDSMLLHHSLYPEMQKGLGFLGSIYTDESSWKLMRRKRPDTEKRDE